MIKINDRTKIIFGIDELGKECVRIYSDKNNVFLKKDTLKLIYKELLKDQYKNDLKEILND